MTLHHICLTIDTDPDGLNTHTPDRADLRWDGLHFAMERFHQAMPEIPLTWYVRADGQLENAYGSLSYLLDKYADFWREALKRGDELGWHPHLYTSPNDGSAPQIITESAAAVAELSRIWASIKDSPLPMPSFRMGEAWHTSETLNLIEQLGFTVDSTAIPNRDDSASGHPRNWKDAPNQPYYPQKEDIRKAGEKRPLLEVPMNSWNFQAPYDKAPKLRYMNPCIHKALWEEALEGWLEKINKSNAERYAWVLILHPAEAMPKAENDQLYAYSIETLIGNLDYFTREITELGHKYVYSTLFESTKAWRARN
jgi:hypothetical protein